MTKKYLIPILIVLLIIADVIYLLKVILSSEEVVTIPAKEAEMGFGSAYRIS